MSDRDRLQNLLDFVTAEENKCFDSAMSKECKLNSEDYRVCYSQAEAYARVRLRIEELLKSSNNEEEQNE